MSFGNGGGGSGGGFRGVRVSRFRHVYGQSSRREQCYESLRITTSAHDSQFCAVNPKFIAVAIDVAGGGAFQVLPLKWTGKVDYHFGRVSGHNGPVTDLKWNPFNDNVIASASDDGTVKLWYMPDEGLRMHVNEYLKELPGHSRRVTYIEWHPTANDILASTGLDSRLLLWNVATGDCIIDIACHPDIIHSMSWSKNGALLATTCKDHRLRLIEPRTGDVIREVQCHEGSKATKVCILGDTGKLVTTGFNRSSRRQILLWNMNDFSKPLVTLEIDSSAGVLFPFYDQDLNMLYVAGKGDGNIRYYEITDVHPYIYFLAEFQSRFPHRGFGIMPKRGVNVSSCEIFRLYKVHTMQPLVEPLSFIVPRKSELFQSDLYPVTAGPTPAMTAEEWLCGMDRDPITVSLRSGFVPTTAKPVQVKRSLGATEEKILITSDRNNDKKFRFLSEVTKPDYREVKERDDFGQLQKDIELQQRLAERLQLRATPHATQTSATRSSSNPPMLSTTGSHDNVLIARHERVVTSMSPPPSPLNSAPASMRCPTVLATSQLRWPSSTMNNNNINNTNNNNQFVTPTAHSPTKIARLSTTANQQSMEVDASDTMRPTGKTAPLAAVDTPPGPMDNDSTTSAASSSDLDRPPSCDVSQHQYKGPMREASGSSRASFATTGSSEHVVNNNNTTTAATTTTTGARSAAAAKIASSKSTYGQSITRPGRIGPPHLSVKRDVQQVRPFRVQATSTSSGSAADTNRQTNGDVSHNTSNGSVSPRVSTDMKPPLPPTPTTTTNSVAAVPEKDSELAKLYASQCRRVRELLQTVDDRDQRVSQLEADLAALTARFDKMATEAQRAQDDIRSLRYEIDWKNERIVFLEAQLTRATSGEPDRILQQHSSTVQQTQLPVSGIALASSEESDSD